MTPNDTEPNEIGQLARSSPSPGQLRNPGQPGSSASLRLCPLVVSAPFGNYVQPQRGASPERTFTSTLGTFTKAPRSGRIWRVLKTVRYYPRIGAWVNKIGLRNPGIDWLVDRVRGGRLAIGNRIVSVHGFVADDWWTLFDRLAPLGPLAIELNISCPNVGEMNWPGSLFERAVATELPVIVKLPPVHYDDIFTQAFAAGVRTFHCCNTLPVPAGGLSGQPLKPVALECIRRLRHELPGGESIAIIGGGGIRSAADIEAYAQAGSNRFAVGTKVFNPLYLWSHRGLEPLISAARGQATDVAGILECEREEARPSADQR